jgi:hypothetical protein
MKLGLYLAITGVVAMLFGLEFLLLPEFALKQYGVPTDPHNVMQSRYFGATLLAFGLVPWLGRSLRDDAALRVILLAGVVGNAIGAIISALAAIAGLQNQMAWGSVLIYAVFLAGNLYYLSSSARRT